MQAVKRYVLLFLLLSGINSKAQNLVVNPGFENLNNPPSGNALLLEEYLPNWYSYVTTPDYYSNILWGATNVLNYCNTLPRTGDGMVGAYQLGVFSVGYNREFIQGELSSPLKAGSIYYAEVYVKPYRKPPVIIWGLRNIGMAFTDKHYNTIASAPDFLISEVPEVEHQQGIITDLNDWTKISGCFVAQGGETKIIIGNFTPDGSCDKQLIPGASGSYDISYYFFDDISVVEIGAITISPDTLICANDTISLTASYPNAGAYSWNTGAVTPSIEVSQAGTYTVTVTTPEGCSVNASTVVATKICKPVVPPATPCPPMVLPDAFTPNSDGRNDLWHILNPLYIYLEDMSVYNRWGERVFYSRDIYKGWDGNYKGEPVDMGVYSYQINYRDCHNDIRLYKKGMLTLVR